MNGKLIVIEGTDCSGKQTQSEMLEARLKRAGKKVVKLSFPMYDTPTGKIIGASYLGKPEMGPCLFEEGAVNVDPKVASLLYAADRLYNKPVIESYLDQGYIVILDRYVESNMAHQGGKFNNQYERIEMYQWLENLEYRVNEMPVPDHHILLHLPHEHALKNRKNRVEAADQHEASEEHLRDAEKAYQEIANMFDFTIISCADGDHRRSREDVNEELYNVVTQSLSRQLKV